MSNWLSTVQAEARRIAEDASGARPQILEFHPGLSCPLHCHFCHTSRGTNSIYDAKSRPGSSTLDAQQIKEIVCAFAKLGGRSVVVSGGLEPFMSPLALTCLAEAKNVGLLTSVYTSGVATHLTKSTVPKVLQVSDRFRVSLSAISAEVYQKVYLGRASASSATHAFSRALEMAQSAISMSGSTGTQVGIQFLLCTENLTECADAIRFWSIAGAEFIDLRLDIVAERRLSPAHLDAIRNQITQLQKAFPSTSMELRSMEHGDHRTADQCIAWRSSIVIDAYGGAHVCCLTADRSATDDLFGLGTVRTAEDFDALMRRVERKLGISPHCTTCADRTKVLNIRVQDKLASSIGDRPR